MVSVDPSTVSKTQTLSICHGQCRPINRIENPNIVNLPGRYMRVLSNSERGYNSLSSFSHLCHFGGLLPGKTIPLLHRHCHNNHHQHIQPLSQPPLLQQLLQQPPRSHPPTDHTHQHHNNQLHTGMVGTYIQDSCRYLSAGLKEIKLGENGLFPLKGCGGWGRLRGCGLGVRVGAVSYTHLTLPTRRTV